MGLAHGLVAPVNVSLLQAVCNSVRFVIVHVPDGFLDATTSVATGAVAVAGVALALRGARKELDDRTAPMAGLVATFVFAGQMMNFPVGAGTSGHLLGGALAAVLAGPWTGVLCISVVLLVQALFMADGGITALGTNITLMGLIGVGVAWLVFRGLTAVLPRRLSVVAPAAAVAAFVSVPVTAVVFTLLFALGGTAPIDTGPVLAAMVGWHLVIGLGEAAITGLVVGSVVGVRPDLVYGASRALRDHELEIRPAVA
jgi:cobalt/nickel transport system permease protein